MKNGKSGLQLSSMTEEEQELKRSIGLRSMKCREKDLTAWGETKKRSEWLQDPRCKLTNTNTIRNRLNRGYAPEDAISIPAGGVTPDKRLIEVWGIRRTTYEHSRDKRSVVGYDTARDRIKRGWDAQDAFELPPGESPAKKGSKHRNVLYGLAEEATRMKW